PRQVPEVDEEVGGDAANLRIDVLWLEDPRPERCAVRTGSGFELLDQLVSGCFVPRGFDDALRFATLDVEEQSPVIAPVAPCHGPGPIDRDILERNRASVDRFVERQVSLLDQPVVEAQAAHHGADRKSIRLNSSHVKISYA